MLAAFLPFRRPHQHELDLGASAPGFGPDGGSAPSPHAPFNTPGDTHVTGAGARLPTATDGGDGPVAMVRERKAAGEGAHPRPNLSVGNGARQRSEVGSSHARTVYTGAVVGKEQPHPMMPVSRASLEVPYSGIGARPKPRDVARQWDARPNL